MQFLLEWMREKLPGLAAAAGIAVLSVLLGQVYPVVGPPIFAIALGILARSFWGLPASLRAGVSWAGKWVLQASIVLLGAGYSLDRVLEAGADALWIIFMVVSAAFVVSLGVGRLLKTPSSINSLIGVGTGICGASAIAALAPIVSAEDREVSYAISTIFLGNLVAIVLFPVIGHVLGLSEAAFGVWAGTAVNDTSSVVATAFAYGSEAGARATVVKLARTLMLVPVVLIASLLATGRAGGDRTPRAGVRRLVPWFVIGFIIVALLRTYEVIPPAAGGLLNELGRYGLVVALAGVGLATDLRGVLRVSWRPLALGMAAWLAVAALSLVAIVWA